MWKWSGAGNLPFSPFKVTRMKPAWTDLLAPVSAAILSQKWTMTYEDFISWLEHFVKYRNAGRTLMMFDSRIALGYKHCRSHRKYVLHCFVHPAIRHMN